MKRKIVTSFMNIFLLIVSFLLFLCTPRTEWGSWDEDAILVIRVLGVVGLMIALPQGFCLYKRKKLVNLVYDIAVTVFCLCKITITF